MAVKIFLCYAHEDEELLNKLKAHLKPLQRQGLIDVWHDRDISASTEWEQEIKKRLEEAQVILLLVSPDFINSEYCYSRELQSALERHRRDEAVVIPIILRHVHWKGILGNLTAFPTDAKPIMSSFWPFQDEAFLNVVTGVHQEVVKLLPLNQKGDERLIGQEDKVTNSLASKGNIPKWSQLFFSKKNAVLVFVLIFVAIIAIMFSIFLPGVRALVFWNHPTQTPPPTFTQSGPIDLTPNGDSYGHKTNSWSKPAYNGYCQLPDCDLTSKRVDMLTEGSVVTATCWTYGQMVITGNGTNPGYKDIRWVRLDDGTYLPNTWFMRDRLSPQLPRC